MGNGPSIDSKLIETVQENTPSNATKHKRIVLEHCALKGLQFGGAASLILLPPYYYFVRRFHFFHILSRLNTVAGANAIAASGASVAVGAARLHNMSQDEVYDRAYRLNHNSVQNHFDFTSVVAAFSLGTVTSTVGYPFLYKPHFGVTLPKELIFKRVMRGTLAAANGFGIGLLFGTLCLPLFLHVMEMQEKQDMIGLTGAQARGLEFVEEVVGAGQPDELQPVGHST